MTRNEIRAMLAARISAEEREMLNSSDSGLYISDFNRSVCKRIFRPDAEDDGKSVDERSINELECSLRDFLSEYMSDHPEGHKWIILACLQLAFVEGLPMHPQTSANWTYRDGNYYCPSMQKDSIICRYCACEEDDEPNQAEFICCAN